MAENDEQHSKGVDMVAPVTPDEIREADALFELAQSAFSPDTPPDVVNRKIGLILATRSRNDVAAMHNLIVINIAAAFKKIDVLIETVQVLTAENIALKQEVSELEELVAAFGEADYEADSVRKAKKEQALRRRKSNNK